MATSQADSTRSTVNNKMHDDDGTALTSSEHVKARESNILRQARREHLVRQRFRIATHNRSKLRTRR